MILKQEDVRHTWVRRRLVSPVVRLLRRGTSPQQLAWSLATGFVIGINPVFGISTVTTIAVTHLFKMNHPASQLGTHMAYPIQIALFLPFLQAGAVLFGSRPVPYGKTQLLALIREHPMQMLQSLWVWEWHALVLWIGLAAVLIPALAILLTRMLERAMRHPRISRQPAEQVNPAN